MSLFWDNIPLWNQTQVAVKRGMPSAKSSLHSVEYTVFRELLTKAREVTSLTQRDVARRLERSQSFVSKYESGERRVDMCEFVKIARALEADPISLLSAYMERSGE